MQFDNIYGVSEYFQMNHIMEYCVIWLLEVYIDNLIYSQFENFAGKWKQLSNAIKRWKYEIRQHSDCSRKVKCPRSSSFQHLVAFSLLWSFSLALEKPSMKFGGKYSLAQFSYWWHASPDSYWKVVKKSFILIEVRMIVINIQTQYLLLFLFLQKYVGNCKC